MKKRNLDYHKMLKEINALVQTDACDNYCCKRAFNEKFTQKESQEMAEIIGKVYSIAHGISCVCGDKYIKK